MTEIISRVIEAAVSEVSPENSSGHLRKLVVLEDMGMEVSHVPSSPFASSDCCHSQLQHLLLERLEAPTRSLGPFTMELYGKYSLALTSASSS